MFQEIIFVILGMTGLWISAEVVIRSAQIIANKLKISDTFVGLTILSIGTSLPEIGTHIVSSLAILKGHDLSGIAVSTNIGSNIIQITAILGIVAFFLKIKSDKKFLDGDYLVMLIAIVLIFVFGYNGIISRAEGAFLVILYLLYLGKLGKSEHFVEKITSHNSNKQLILHALAIPVGIAALLFSSHLAVFNAESLASMWNVKDTLVGALILGLGTALPELAAALVAIRRKAEDMSIGVLIGSNITNPMLGIGIGALISTYTISESLLWLDLPFWFFTSVVVLLFFWRNLKIEKKEAIIMMGFYLAYILLKLKFMA